MLTVDYARLGVRPDDRVLDLGCGFGRHAYQAARLIAKAIAARMVLLNPSNGMDKSELARKATYEIGGNYQAIAVYDQAAIWYEKYADLKPMPEKADQALSDAVQLQLGLGHEDEAIKDADAFRKKFGASKASETAAIQFAIGAHYAEKEDWTAAKLALSGSMSIINKAPPDIQVQAHATLGRALQILFAYRQGVKRLRALRRRRAEIELFERLARCMQSDRVE